MAFETSSYASSSLQSLDAPKELLLVLSILNEKQQQQQQQRWWRKRYDQQQQQHQQLQQQQSQQHMELSQIELIYRAEGNANLVLALPQFKKVLRLPKIQQKQQQQEPQYQETEYNQKYSKQHQHRQEQHIQQQRQHEMSQQEPNKILTTGQQQTKNAVGILTMDHYVAYISIIRCLVGNEFVLEADIVAVPNPNDRDWINEHIRPYRPANRLDKEFGGHFGLLLPDATQLPAEFDILFSNLQSTTTTTATEETSQCGSNNIFFGQHTYAIEIKPKQGWLLPNDVNNLFDIKPTGTTEAASTSESVKVLKKSTDKECLTTTQNRPPSSQPTVATVTATSSTAGAVPAAAVPAATPSPSATRISPTRDDKISHSLYDKVDIRCRYCSMQFLKLTQQKINKRNNYCPLGLFSGVTEQMLDALDALFECPQNNLRVFKNGNLIFDDQLSRTSKIEDLFASDKLQLIKHLLVTCLLREYAKEEQEETACAAGAGGDEEKQVNKETEGNLDGGGGSDGDDGQPQSSVTLCKKLKINTMPTAKTEVTKVKTTSTETETIPSAMTASNYSSLSSSTHSVVSLDQINKAEVLCLPKNCVLQKILHLQLLAKINLQYMLDQEYAHKKEKLYCILHELLKKFAENQNQLKISQLLPEEQYLLAATLLDCSIMITFCEIENTDTEQCSYDDSPFLVVIGGKKFLTKVTLLDLDPKPDTHFAKYCQQTKEIVNVLQKL